MKCPATNAKQVGFPVRLCNDIKSNFLSTYHGQVSSTIFSTHSFLSKCERGLLQSKSGAKRWPKTENLPVDTSDSLCHHRAMAENQFTHALSGLLSADARKANSYHLFCSMQCCVVT